MTVERTDSAKLERKHQRLVADIHRWQVKLDKADRTVTRSVKMLAKLERSRLRLENKMREAPAPMATPAPEPPRVEAKAEVLGHSPDDGLDIPKQFRRDLNRLPDPRTKEKKAERRAVEREVREAELTGKRRKMPLTGKAAIDAISSA